jgi:hypothetical protein
MVNDMESNIVSLNNFIRSHYDLSFNVLTNVKIVTFDSSDVILSCVHTDSSGNFVSCDDLSMNHIPCVLNPMTKTSKTHISDIEKGFHYPYHYRPHYPYPYPYPHRPPYYPILYRDTEDNPPVLKTKPIDHTNDVKKGFPYDPFYGYGYGYGYPYNPYYSYLSSDDMYCRDMDLESP